MHLAGWVRFAIIVYMLVVSTVAFAAGHLKNRELRRRIMLIDSVAGMIGAILTFIALVTLLVFP